MNKFIKINTASGGPFLVNANDIGSVVDKGGFVRIHTSSQRHFDVFKSNVISGTHSSALQSATGTTTATNSPNWPPKLIDANAQFTSNSLLLPGDAIFLGDPLTFSEATEGYYDPFILSDTELQLQGAFPPSGAPYSITSGSIISDNSADFIAAGVQVGQNVSLNNDDWGSSQALVSAVTATTITLANRYDIEEPYGQKSLSWPEGYSGGDGTTYAIVDSANIEIQEAINAAIGDVLNNTYSHVVEVPIVVQKMAPKYSDN